MRKTREEKAITLIALIITIIVLLILAVVTINAIQNDGIISYAKNSTTEYGKAQDKEKLTLDMLNWQMMSEDERPDLINHFKEKYGEENVQIDTDGKSLLVTTSNGVYRVTETGNIEEATNSIPDSAGDLQEKHEFEYYSTLSKAIADANNGTKENVDANADTAVAGIYEEDGKTNVVLMKDTESSESIYVTGNMTINLAGNTLKFTTPEACMYVGKSSAGEIEANDVTIDGRIGGSSIEKNIEDASSYTSAIEIIQVDANSLVINSGTYSVTANNANKVFVMRANEQNAKFQMTNAKVIASNNAESSESSKYTRGVRISSIAASINNCSFDTNTNLGFCVPLATDTNANLKLSNTKINASSDNGYVYGLWNKDNGVVTINNTNIYTDASNNDLKEQVFSIGVLNTGGKINFHSGYADGTFAGFHAQEGAESYTYGGTLYGKGSYGMSYDGYSGNVKTYIENANIISGEYNGKYTFAKFNGIKNNAMGIVNTSSSSINIYMDNCNITGNNKAIETSGTGAVNINISNSRITGEVGLIANKILNLGQGMADNLTITGDGTVNRTGLSYKGYDKTLMAEN